MRARAPGRVFPALCAALFMTCVAGHWRALSHLQAAEQDGGSGHPQATRVLELPDPPYHYDNLVELPIHQDVTPDQVDHMARCVLSLGLHF